METVATVCFGSATFTMVHIADILNGKSTKKIQKSKRNLNENYGLLKEWDRSSIQRLLNILLIDKYLPTRLHSFVNGIPNVYLKLGPNSSKLFTGDVEIQLSICGTSRETTNLYRSDKLSTDVLYVIWHTYSEISDLFYSGSIFTKD